MSLTLAAGITLAASAIAQPVIDENALPAPRQSVEIDLDGDGRTETASVYSLNDKYDVITIRAAAANGDFDFDEGFVLPINLADSDSLYALPNGNLRITWGCLACGRYHTQSSVTVDAHGGEIQVIGYDDTYADRLFAAVFSCSVNLLTGDVIVEADAIEQRTLTTDARSYPLADLRTSALPQVCVAAYARYDDNFMAKNFPDH